MAVRENVRGIIKPNTIERLGKYAKIRIGIGVDDLINEALDNIESRAVELPIKAKESRRGKCV